MGLTKSYMKIKNYGEDLFCTAEINTVPYWIYIYKQHVNRILLVYPIFMSIEILETLKILQAA